MSRSRPPKSRRKPRPRVVDLAADEHTLFVGRHELTTRRKRRERKKIEWYFLGIGAGSSGRFFAALRASFVIVAPGFEDAEFDEDGQVKLNHAGRVISLSPSAAVVAAKACLFGLKLRSEFSSCAPSPTH